MDKKNFCTSINLVKKKDRWYFDFWVFDTRKGQQNRFRKDFNINSIDDLEKRGVVAHFIEKNINYFIAFGGDVKPKTGYLENSESVSVVIEKMAKVKIASSKREHSTKTYKSANVIFQKYLEVKKISGTPIMSFTHKDAIDFQDYLSTHSKNYAATTVNNRCREMMNLFGLAKKREIIKENPFANLERKKQAPKKRRPFTEDERILVANYAKEHDYWLYRAIVLQFYCGIRPVELTRLRFGDFDFVKGVVWVSEGDAKNYKKSARTMPKHLLSIFLDKIFTKYSTSWYPFGVKNRPSSTTNEKTHSAYNAHKRILKHLKDTGVLKNTEGLQWYSWKDTHASVNSKHVSPYSLKDQFNHSDLKTSMLYYAPDVVNDDYRNLPDTLHKKKAAQLLEPLTDDIHE